MLAVDPSGGGPRAQDVREALVASLGLDLRSVGFLTSHTERALAVDGSVKHGFPASHEEWAQAMDLQRQARLQWIPVDNRFVYNSRSLSTGR